MRKLPLLFMAALLWAPPAQALDPEPLETTTDEMMTIEFFSEMLLSEKATGLLSEGMDESLPMDFLTRNKFVPFEAFRDRPKAPIAVKVFFDGAEVRAKEMHKVFTEELLAWVPKNESIIPSKDSEGRTLWDYPLNTKVIHYITLNNAEDEIFELRMVHKVEEKRWAFGIYRPENGILKLQHYTGFRENAFSVETRDHGPVHVQLQHIPLNVCQRCHARTTAAPYQYDSLAQVGPCEFTPPNPHVEEKWAPAFEETHGHPPIAR